MKYSNMAAMVHPSACENEDMHALALFKPLILCSATCNHNGMLKLARNVKVFPEQIDTKSEQNFLCHHTIR